MECKHDWQRGYLVIYAGAFRQCDNCRKAQIRPHWWNRWQDYVSPRSEVAV